jgi:hypothetical protein
MNYCNPTWNNGGNLSATDITGLQKFYGKPKRSGWVARRTVSNGYWGSWSSVDYCPSSSWASSYRLRIESDQGDGDDTSLNAVSLTCKTKSGTSAGTITPHSGLWGSWSSWSSSCATGHAMTQANMLVEPWQGSGDDTAGNDIHFYCNSDGARTVANGQQRGTWSGWVGCPTGSAICGVMARTEGSQGSSGDDTAMNGLQIDCCTF